MSEKTTRRRKKEILNEEIVDSVPFVNKSESTSPLTLISIFFISLTIGGLILICNPSANPCYWNIADLSQPKSASTKTQKTPKNNPIQKIIEIPKGLYQSLFHRIKISGEMHLLWATPIYKGTIRHKNLTRFNLDLASMVESEYQKLVQNRDHLSLSSSDPHGTNEAFFAFQQVMRVWELKSSRYITNGQINYRNSLNKTKERN